MTEIARHWLHPKYIEVLSICEEIQHIYDLALVKLKTKITFSKTAKPICLATANDVKRQGIFLCFFPALANRA